MMMRRLLGIALLTAIFSSPLIASPARACSCATPADIAAWVDESEAAFVGTLIEKRDAGFGNDFGDQSIFVFEVEHWVKGDAGDVIEVHSASNGAACGFEFWNSDNRTGAIIHEENGRLHGSLCSQVDADVLLAAVAGPTPSETGVPAILVARGWNSVGIDVLDVSGGHITTIRPPGEPEDFDGTRTFHACPGDDLAVQQTSGAVHVWDLHTLEIVSTHHWSEDINVSWIESSSCRAPDASKILVVVASEFSRELIDLVSGETFGSVDGWVTQFSDEFVLFQPDSAEEQMLLLNLRTGEQRPVVDVPPGEIRGVYASIRPNHEQLAVLEVFYTGSDREPDSTLSLVDLEGNVQISFEIEGESQAPQWIDEHRVYVQSLSWNGDSPSNALVIDINTGESKTLEGFVAWEFATDGRVAVGANGGEIIRADLESGAVETMTVLPSPQSGPIVLVAQDAASQPVGVEEPIPATQPTTPPLIIEQTLKNVTDSNARMIAGIAVGIAAVGLVWLAISTRRPREPN